MLEVPAWLLCSVIIRCVLLQGDRRHRKVERRLKGGALRKKEMTLFICLFIPAPLNGFWIF